MVNIVITEFQQNVEESTQSVILAKRWEYNQHVQDLDHVIFPDQSSTKVLFSVQKKNSFYCISDPDK